jgi:hypothetical protein
MSAIRKIVLSAATLFLGLSGMFLAVSTATAAPAPVSVTIDCDDEWHTPCP